VAEPTRPPFAWAEPFLTVGTTGTNGKTSTTLLVAHALRAGGRSVLSETTLGYRFDDEELDVPRSTAGFYAALEGAAKRGARHAAVEVTSEALARGFAKRWRFDIGVFTNLTRDHLDAHGSWEHYLASKAQLFAHLPPSGAAILNGCDEVAPLLDRITPPAVRRIFYGSSSRGERRVPLDLAVQKVTLAADGTTIDLEPSVVAEQLGKRLFIQLVGEVFAENALAAACAALHAGTPGEAVVRGLSTCSVVPGRFEVLHRDPIVAVDFAHTPDALARVCDSARALAAGARVIVVFGAGGERDKGKREPMGAAVATRADEAIITTDNPRREDPRDIERAIAKGAKNQRARVRKVPDRRAAIEAALGIAKTGDVVVIAGKGHEQGQIIGTEVHPFSDVDLVRELTGARTSR
jgi:UDP-N-acetylmuramoyl-L-alanyl-D-glutamate--2,6-diaminopimelate ligase